MVTSEHEVGGKGRKLLTDLAPFSESLAKGVAAITVAVYVCGFLTVSLHHANYGFIGTSPFRPRILAAGAWFLFLTAIPVAVATRYRDRPWVEVGGSLAFIWYVFYGISSTIFYLFDLRHQPSPNHHWWDWVFITGVLLAFALYLFALKSKKGTSVTLALASVALVFFMSAFLLPGLLGMRAFDLSHIALWFLGIFLVTILQLKTRPGDYSGERLKGLGVDVGLIFLVLFVFAHYYYPHIKASWGGGSPVDVTIYFTKDSVIRPGQCVSAQLLEESDEGFYFVSPPEARAIYIPRNSVALLYFSGSTSDSAFLRDKK